MPDIYMKIDSVAGESSDTNHAQWIEINSISHGLRQPTTSSQSAAGGRTAGRVDMEDFTITKELDCSSPVLINACCEGLHYKEVKIELFRATAAGGQRVKYMEYILSDTIVSSYSVSGYGQSIPNETIKLNFGSIKWSYIPQKKEAPGGAAPAIPASWSLTQNKKAT